MRLKSFRIKNFRSIVDTGWVHLSGDNVTALVGQNESGKTAILEALAKTFSSATIEVDDLRHDEPLPQIWLNTEWTTEEITVAADNIEAENCRKKVVGAITAGARRITWSFSAERDKNDEKKLVTIYRIEEPELSLIVSNHLQFLAKAKVVMTVVADLAKITPAAKSDEQVDEATLSLKSQVEAILDELKDGFFEEAPHFVLFEERTGLLPNQIQITETFTLEKGEGRTAAQNFLTIAGIKLNALIRSDTRARAAILKKANKKITDDFLAFWSQTIGKNSTLNLECSVHQHAEGHERAGKSYLEFLIDDGAAALYPKQRSKGTRWFISFFLQLRASQIEDGNVLFLLDEPGSNLHEKAQVDVLTLIEKIREKIAVIYSTHSPHLISEKSLHRILAIERGTEKPSYATRIIDTHALGAASTDTLSPIFTAMGVSLSRQTAIKKHNNVILEELSSYYYLRAFWRLTGCTQEVNFLPATGTSNVPLFAQLFLGWGLDFIVVVDDEPSGRAVYKNLKRDLFLDDENWAARRLIKVKGCEGIEDIFEVIDYKSFVVNNSSAVINEGNARWAKDNGAAKAIHALKFLQQVDGDQLNLAALHESTQQRITDLVKEIHTRLKNY